MRIAALTLRWVLVGIVVLLALVAGTIFLLTRTPWGVERVGRYAVASIGSSIHGRLTVRRIESGSLLGGMTLRDVAITDSVGNPFVAVDSARASYSWRSLLGGQIVLGSLDLYHPRVVIEEIPGDTLWNYEKIFNDTSTAPGAPRLMQFSDVTVHDGEAVVAFPIDQPGPIQPSDTARMIVRRAGRGLQRVLRFDGLNAELPSVLWESPQEPGRMLKIAKLSGRGFVWTTPFHLQQAAGTVALHDSVVAFSASDVRFPLTRGSLAGRVVVHNGSNDYDIRIAGDRLAFADLDWLYPRLPRQGGGTGTIRILTVPRGTLWLISDARLQAPGTNVAGSFGIVTGDTLYFTQVSLRASPFDLKLVQSMLPGKLPIQGLLVGTVVVQGPLSALRTHGDLRLAGGPGGAAPSTVRWSGTVDLGGPYGARDFHADIGSLDLALLTALDPTLKLQGNVSGKIDANGRLDRSVSFVADLQHTLTGVSASHMTGSGTVSWSRRSSSFDVKLEALPLALDALGRAFPALRRLEGSARGPVTVKGSLADLLVDADLATPAGRVAVNGRFDLASKRPAYHAAGELTGFHLDQLLAGLPATTVSGRYRIDGGGNDLATADAVLAADLTGGRMAGVPLRFGTLRVSVAGGLARFDSLQLATAAGTLRGEGSFGVKPGRSGTLDLRVDADSVGALQPIFFADTTGPGEEPVRRMGGSLRAHATLTGALDAFDVSGEATLSRLRFGDGSAARGQVSFSGRGLGSTLPGWHVRLDADSLRFRQYVFAATKLDAGYASPSGTLSLESTGADAGKYSIAGDYRLRGDTADLALEDLRFGAGASAWRLVAPASARYHAGALDGDSLALVREGGGSIRAAGRLAWGGSAGASAPLGFRLDLQGAPIQDFLGLTGAETGAGGRVTGHLDVAGTAGKPVLDLVAYVDSARFQELRFDRLDTRFAYADRAANAHVQGFLGGSAALTAQGRVPMDLALVRGGQLFPNDSIDATVSALRLPASLATTLLDGFSGVRGRLDGQVKIGGTVRAPRFNGEVRLADGAGFWLPSGVTYTGTQASFRMAGDGAIAVDASAAAGTGTATAKGRIVVGSDWTNPTFDLTARMQNFLAARRRDADVTASGDIRLLGRYRAPEVRGAIRVDRGVLNVDEVWRLYNIVALDDSLLFNVVDTSVASVRKVLTQQMESDFMRNLLVDSFTVDVGQNGWLRGKQMNVEVQGDLAVYYRRAADDLRLTGVLSAVRGNYLLYGGRRFDVRGGTVEFLGTSAFDPNLDITAVYKLRTTDTGQPLNISANVTGTLTYPRVALSSDQPGISQSDLVSYMVFGLPTYRLTPGQSSRLQFATGALTGSAFGYLSSELESVARNVGFDYLSLTSGETAPRGTDTGTQLLNARNLLSPFATAQIEIGRYIGDQFFLAASAGRNAYGASTPLRGARLEWRVRPTWISEFFIDDRAARVPSAGYTLDQTLAQQKVLGFFLYREWGY